MAQLDIQLEISTDGSDDDLVDTILNSGKVTRLCQDGIDITREYLGAAYQSVADLVEGTCWPEMQCEEPEPPIVSEPVSPTLPPIPSIVPGFEIKWPTPGPSLGDILSSLGRNNLSQDFLKIPETINADNPVSVNPIFGNGPGQGVNLGFGSEFESAFSKSLTDVTRAIFGDTENKLD